MSDERNAAIVNARVARAMIRMNAMQAANSQYPSNQPFRHEDFEKIITDEGIGENSVLIQFLEK